MKKILQTLYLRLDSTSRSLTRIALAQLILKIVFSFSKPPSKNQIIGELSGLLGTKISNEKIEDALDLLIGEKKLLLDDSGIVINDHYKKKIQSAYDQFLERQDRIVDRFFRSVETDKNSIKRWFEDVTLEFFKEYSSEWVSDLCFTENTIKSRHEGILHIIDRVSSKIKEVKDNDKEHIKNQYIKFIQSNDPDTYSLLWDYGTSCFSSTLITANTSADPITIEEFRNSKCILDTNILMYLDLEKSKYKESFEAMENVFKNLGIQPIYFLITREEFIRSMTYKRDQTIKVIDNYPYTIVEETKDPFLLTAVHRECKTEEDFIRFFDQLLDIPAFIANSLAINSEDSLELEEAIKVGQANDELKNKLNAVYKGKTGLDKRKGPLTHDAGLISGAKHIRAIEKCFILSRDITINEYASENPVRQELPISIALNTLINVLALDNGGADIDPTEYAPLFANIVKLALIPEHDVFKLEDLSRMIDVQAQISDLPEDKIRDIARELHHNKVRNVSDEEISLQLNRRFQGAKLELKSDLETAKKETLMERNERERQTRKSQRASGKLKEKLAAELRDKYDTQILRNRLFIFLILPALTILLTSIIIYLTEEDKYKLKDQIIGIGINILAWLLTDFFFLDRRIRKKYSERVQKIDEDVDRQVEELLEE